MQVESVAYIGASQSELFFVFGISALLLSLRDKLNNKHLLIISLLLLFSLLTKETGVLFLLIIPIIQVLLKKKKVLNVLFYEILVVVVYCIIRFGYAGIFFQKNIYHPLGKLSLIERFINIPAIFFYYLKTFFYPAKLGIDQLWTVTSINFQHFYFPLITDILFWFFVSFTAFYIYKKAKEDFKIFLFFLAWFILGMAMLLQIFPLDMTVADRWMYFPIVGLLGMIGVAIKPIITAPEKIKKICICAFVCISILLSVRTIVRNSNWQNPIMLYTHDIKIDDNYDLEGFLGAELAFAGQYHEALKHLLKANDLLLRDSTVLNIGSVYDLLNDSKNSKKYYSLVISGKNLPYVRDEIKKNAYIGMAKLLFLHDKPEVTRDFVKKAIKIYPNEGTYWSYLAVSEYRLNNKQEALVAAKKAKKLIPNQTTAALYNIILQNKPLTIKY
jgi:tetratricopeptide (TPR) repeat protein